MPVTPLGCLTAPDAPARLLHALRPATLSAYLAGRDPPTAALLAASGFTAAAGQGPILLHGPEGIEAVVGLGDDRTPFAFGDLATRLPEGNWRLVPGGHDPDAALLGFCLGAYGFTEFRAPARAPARLVPPAGHDPLVPGLAETIGLVRDLINQPANSLGPAQLADAAATIAAAAGAACTLISGAALAEAYPAIAAVGAAADRPPVVVRLAWAGSGAGATSPLLSLCGKGVVFDTGGLDLKPSASMLRMKKDMGGAAILLGRAREIMRRDWPIRLELRLGCVENAVGGAAVRPGDILRTKAGPTVEIGNTDAEGRLVLADLLAEASAAEPALLVDCATLTGAARVALGPDLPALFCTDDQVARCLVGTGQAVADPVWQLPLWDGYDPWLASPVADLNNVAAKPLAGAIIAALFLRRFVRPGTVWAHLDTYAWNDQSRPGRPEGGEAQGLRALLAALPTILHTKP